MSEIKPITPQEAKKDVKCNIPDFVITGINNAIKNNYHKSGFLIKQKEIISEILKISPNTQENIIYNNNWLDFEELYENYGWNISYESPDRSETFDSYFYFKHKNNI